MSSQQKRLFLMLAGGLVGMLVLGFMAGGIAGYLDASDGGATSVGTSTRALWILGAFAAVAMVAATLFNIKWMRSIDEAAQEAHKSAWFWGGTAGMSVGMVVLVLSSLPHAESLRVSSMFSERTDPAAYMATGAFGILFLMLIGYGLAWLWWWWSRR